MKVTTKSWLRWLESYNNIPKLEPLCDASKLPSFDYISGEMLGYLRCAHMQRNGHNYSK